MYKLHLKYLLGFNIIKTKYNYNKNILKFFGKLKNNKIKISGNSNELYIGENSLIRKCNIYIKGNNNKLYIGKNVVLENSNIIFDNEHSEITIGDYTSAGGAQIVSLEPYPIKIGENCMISYDVEIRNTDSHKIFNISDNKRINEGKAVEIEDNVWIGTKVLILKGVKIENGAIIAAGSIVNKNVAKNVIAAGNPVKEIKRDIYWTREEVMKR